jgi:hypothetical protein
MFQYQDMSQQHSDGNLHHTLACFSPIFHPQVGESQELAGGSTRLVLAMDQISSLWK